MPYNNLPPELYPSDQMIVPIDQSGGTHITPADDSKSLAISPADGLNPYLMPDGFSYLCALKYLPYRAFPMQLRLLTQYRKEALQGMWLPRWYTCPLDSSVQIAAGDTLNFEIHTAKKGSVLWGWSFAVLAPGTTSQVRIALTDVASGQLLMTQREIAANFTANLTSGTPKAGFPFCLLMHPHLISGQGDLLVEMVNTNVTTALTCQLVLMCLEPK